MKSTELFPLLSLTQGVYYLAAGLWPLVSSRSFQQVTGPKHDIWLVKTVGVLLSVIGGVLALAGLRRQTTREVPALAMASAAALAAVDVAYAGQGRISPVYFLDAAAEAALMVAWLFVRRRGRAVPLAFEFVRRGDTPEPAGDRSREAVGL